MAGHICAMETVAAFFILFFFLISIGVSIFSFHRYKNNNDFREYSDYLLNHEYNPEIFFSPDSPLKKGALALKSFEDKKSSKANYETLSVLEF